MLPDGVGFLRSACNHYRSSPEDSCVLPAIVRRFGLRAGDTVSGFARAPRDPKDRYFMLTGVDRLNGDKPEPNRRTPYFDTLPAMYPNAPLKLETASDELSGRMIDLVAPLGLGQRGLIIAPPGSEGLRLLQKMAAAITENHPSKDVFVVLTGNRPEDITEMTAATKAAVLGVSLDDLPDQSVQVAEIAVDMARRRAESGKDAVVLLDSLTHLADSYFSLQPSAIRDTRGLDSAVWFKMRKLFGAGRALTGGGSLTFVATVVPDEASLAHRQLLTRLRSICNLEIVLDAALAQRAFPAIHIETSRSFREERLLPPDTLIRTQVLRRALSGLPPAESLEMILKKMRNSASNTDFLLSLKDNV
jgi:transcription termination factor Rho